jgi:AcrR family transcriptional regulator
MPPTKHASRVSPAGGRPHKGRRERHKVEIRDRLFRAAIKLFGTRGFTETTVEHITDAADVAKGTFFNYFSTKEMLLTDLMERRLDILRAAREEAQQGRLPLRDILGRLLRSLMVEPGRSRCMARCVLLGALGGEPVESLVQQIMIKRQEILSDVMEIGQRRGEIRGDWPAGRLAHLFQQSFYGVLYLQAFLPNLNLQSCLDATFALYWAGVEARDEPRSELRVEGQTRVRAKDRVEARTRSLLKSTK